MILKLKLLPSWFEKILRGFFIPKNNEKDRFHFCKNTTRSTFCMQAFIWNKIPHNLLIWKNWIPLHFIRYLPSLPQQHEKLWHRIIFRWSEQCEKICLILEKIHILRIKCEWSLLIERVGISMWGTNVGCRGMLFPNFLTVLSCIKRWFISSSH